MLLAASNGNIEKLRSLIDGKGSVNESDAQVVNLHDSQTKMIQNCFIQGATILHRAARHGQTKCVEFAIEQRIGIDVKDNKMLTPLHEACVQVIFFQRTARNNLTMFVLQGQIECVKLLLLAKARTDSQKTNSSVSNGGFMPLHFAAAKGHTEVCRLLLEASADVQGGDRAVDISLPFRLRHAMMKALHPVCAARPPRPSSAPLNPIDPRANALCTWRSAAGPRTRSASSCATASRPPRAPTTAARRSTSRRSTAASTPVRAWPPPSPAPSGSSGLRKPSPTRPAPPPPAAARRRTLR